MDYIKLCKNRKSIGNPYTDCENIRWGHSDGIWHRKCTMVIIKKVTHDGRDRHTKLRKNRTLGEKETYK